MQAGCVANRNWADFVVYRYLCGQRRILSKTVRHAHRSINYARVEDARCGTVHQCFHHASMEDATVTQTKVEVI